MPAVVISQSELSSTMCSCLCSVFSMAVQFDAPVFRLKLLLCLPDVVSLSHQSRSLQSRKYQVLQILYLHFDLKRLQTEENLHLMKQTAIFITVKNYSLLF